MLVLMLVLGKVLVLGRRRRWKRRWHIDEVNFLISFKNISVVRAQKGYKLATVYQNIVLNSVVVCCPRNPKCSAEYAYHSVVGYVTVSYVITNIDSDDYRTT
jgi:hypothetical protein